ncbi:chitinase 2 [Amborella trichopoda]|uniref:chitinase 2 n=1 Tax=Amborella trichopoda TaxID=13333 RepID=UPI0005D39DA8|nr:chitinase 2 [Amborella trichopoda]|eukprot:XP_011628633.1 chitinase 2 [Amborella trichopoda]
MMEYVGATGVEVSFTDVPINPNIDFHFLLSFAIDANTDGEYQNGVFSPYWEPSLTPDSVASIKKQYPNVKALTSLCGWSLDNSILRWYNPKDPEAWIENAVDSLSSIIKTYHLDGIDIDYENFPNNDTTFAYCIGEVITKLKNQCVITVASIAPYYKTVSHYIDLFSRYSGVIDYVNHQFYTDRVKTPPGFLQAFQLRAGQFDREKLLPSYEVNGRGIQGDSFFSSLELLQNNGFTVNGVMIWSGDDSKSDGYYYETKSQEFLLNSTRI